MTDHRMDINVRQEETYMKEIIAKVVAGENLTEAEAKHAMDVMLSGQAT